MDGTSLARRIEARFGPEVVARWLDLILDSGATDHMVRDSDLLCNLQDPPSQILVEVADGNQVSVTAIGDIETEYIKLKGVYLVPKLKKNLVSVNQLARDGITTTFGKNSAELFKGGERVGGAIAEGCLYKVRFLWATGDAAPHTSPAAPGEHITSYVANAASSHMKDLVASLKAKEADWVATLKTKEADLVTSFEDSAVLVDWVESIKDKYMVESIKDKYMICGDWFAPTAKMDESDEIGGAAGCNNMIRDGSFVPGKAHLGSEGMHGTNFMNVQLNEHCLNA